MSKTRRSTNASSIYKPSKCEDNTVTAPCICKAVPGADNARIELRSEIRCPLNGDRESADLQL